MAMIRSDLVIIYGLITRLLHCIRNDETLLRHPQGRGILYLRSIPP